MFLPTILLSALFATTTLSAPADKRQEEGGIIFTTSICTGIGCYRTTTTTTVTVKPTTKPTTTTKPPTPTKTVTVTVTATATGKPTTSTNKPPGTTPTKTESAPPTGPSSTKCPVPLYYQCGGYYDGKPWTGCKVCEKGARCIWQNDWYYQCVADD